MSEGRLPQDERGLNPPCCICGHVFAQKHRIVPGCKGGSYTPENVVHLCPNHHAMIHLRMRHHDFPDRLSESERSRLRHAMQDVGLNSLWQGRVEPTLATAKSLSHPLVLKSGLRIRLNAPTVNGNMGFGTVVEWFGEGPDALVGIRLDGVNYPHRDSWTDCLRHQLTVLQ